MCRTVIRGIRGFQGALPVQGRKPSTRGKKKTSFRLGTWGSIDLGI